MFESPTWKGHQFKKGQSLTFSAVGGGCTRPFADDAVGAIADPCARGAVRTSYLGKDPVVPGAKQSLGELHASHVTG